MTTTAGHQAQLDRLAARFPAYQFWYVPSDYGPDAWCWRPKGSDDGNDSQHRGTPEEAAAAITGTEHEIRLSRHRERTASRG